MNLSKRMETVVDFVPPQSDVVADVGCDHAYVSISLVERKLAKKVIAMDVRKGPLEIATKNIQEAGLHNSIEVRLSNGLEMLCEGEADTIIIAGMGGLLINGILERGLSKLQKNSLHNAPVLVLQPQSELCKVREFLLMHHYSIVKENVMIEEGKFYTVMKAESKMVSDADAMSCDKILQYEPCDFLYGRYNLFHQNQVLKQYLLNEKAVLNKIYEDLERVKEEMTSKGCVMPEKTIKRLEEVRTNLCDNQKAVDRF
ncbi:MAG: tRNA (adenine(22)-N(1))-methyltransferase [Lachnospiraceae bacterium]